IGKAIAEALAGEGAQVAILGHKQDEADNTAGKIKGAIGISADLTKETDAKKAIDTVVKQLGGVHVLVNVAGGGAKFGTFDDLTDEDWQKDIELNLMSAVRMVRAVLPVMRKQGWGRIINVASEDGIQPYPDVPNYACAKAGLLALTKSLSKLVAKDGILVNTVSPAFVMTPLVERMLKQKAEEDGTDEKKALENFLKEKRPNIELKRPGKPEEIAAAVAFLASEKASFILGANLRVDGGSVPSIGA
ncbi:MAG: SDR family NAD(P)-dependent oxidoreductase, partial [Pseudonocardiaceae bacterium]